MECHEKTYASLCAGISEALDVLPYRAETLHAKLLLERALREARSYISGSSFTSLARIIETERVEKVFCRGAS